MRYTVIGLGQFGQELCTELSARNIEVVAVASTDEELEQIIKSISTSGDESIKRLIRAYWRLSDSGKAGFRELLDNLVTEYESGRNAPAVPSTSAGEMTDAEIHAEVDRQLMGEKVAVDELSVSGPGRSDTATA